MKIKLLITFAIYFLIGLSHQVKGQAAILALLFGDKVASENFNISMELGGTFTSFSNLTDTERAKLGINFGIAGNAKLSDNWFISPNIYFLANRKLRFKSYSLNSGNPTLDLEFANVKTVVDLRYIDIPIFISYQSNNRKFRYSIAPQVSFLQSARAVFSGVDGNFVQDFEPFVNSTDYGVIADFGYILGQAHKGKAYIFT